MFNICYYFQIAFYFFMIKRNCYSVLKTFIIFLLIGFIAAFLSFLQSGESIYDPPCLKFILWHLRYNKQAQSNTKLLPLIDISNPITYLDRSD